MKTIKNNNPETTFYSLSLKELKELCEEYKEGIDSDEVSCIYSFLELYIDYIKKSRKN